MLKLFEIGAYGMRANNSGGGTNQDTWQAYMEIAQCNHTVQPKYANENALYKRNVQVIHKTIWKYFAQLFLQAVLFFVCLFFSTVS
jgi:hypothetical protein